MRKSHGQRVLRCLLFETTPRAAAIGSRLRCARQSLQWTLGSQKVRDRALRVAPRSASPQRVVSGTPSGVDSPTDGLATGRRGVSDLRKARRAAGIVYGGSFNSRRCMSPTIVLQWTTTLRHE